MSYALSSAPPGVPYIIFYLHFLGPFSGLEEPGAHEGKSWNACLKGLHKDMEASFALQGKSPDRRHTFLTLGQ